MIFIRTDSNNEVATGHVMRCITIADKLIKYGEKVKFIVKDVDTVNLLDGKFEYINIPVDNIRTIYDEILYIKYIVNSEQNTPKILLDLYIFDAEYMHKLKTFAKVISFACKEYALAKDSVVLLEQLRTIDKKRLKDKVCHLDEDTLLKIDRALEISLELIT